MTHIYTFMRTDDPETIWPTIEIEAENYREAMDILNGMDSANNDQVVIEWHSDEGGGDLGDILRDGEPLRDYWDLATGEIED